MSPGNMRAIVLNHRSPGPLTNLEFSEKANRHNFKLGVYLPLKIFEFAKDLIIPISALYSYILGWVWTGLGSRGREGRGAVSEATLATSVGFVICWGTKVSPWTDGQQKPFPSRVGVGSEEKGLQGHWLRFRITPIPSNLKQIQRGIY